MPTTLTNMGRVAGTPQFAMTAMDYLHDGHLHHMHEDHVDEHVIAVDATNPAKCTPQVHCSHAHGPNCGHQAVPHGDHVDYLVDGRLHHPHGDHCDDHGPVQLA